MINTTLKTLLESKGYIMMNKTLAKHLGIEPTYLLLVMIDGNDMVFSKDGWFFQTAKKIEEITGMSNHRQSSAIKVLNKHEILSQENRGVPCKRYFHINTDKLESFIEKTFAIEEEKKKKREGEKLKKADKNSTNKPFLHSFQESEKLVLKNGETSFQETSKHYKEHIYKEHNINNKKIYKKDSRMENIELIEQSNLLADKKEKLKEWIGYRFDELKKPLKTTRAIKTILKSKWVQEDDAVAFMDYAMNHEWTGLEQKFYNNLKKQSYPVKTKTVSQKKNTVEDYLEGVDNREANKNIRHSERMAFDIEEFGGE